MLSYSAKGKCLELMRCPIRAKYPNNSYTIFG